MINSWKLIGGKIIVIIKKSFRAHFTSVHFSSAIFFKKNDLTIRSDLQQFANFVKIKWRFNSNSKRKQL